MVDTGWKPRVLKPNQFIQCVGKIILTLTTYVLSTFRAEKQQNCKKKEKERNEMLLLQNWIRGTRRPSCLLRITGSNVLSFYVLWFHETYAALFGVLNDPHYVCRKQFWLDRGVCDLLLLLVVWLHFVIIVSDVQLWVSQVFWFIMFLVNVVYRLIYAIYMILS